MRVYRCKYSCALLLSAAFSAPCQPLSDAAPVVDVFIPVVIQFQTAHALFRAQAVATEMYARLGVRLVWHPGATPPKGCVSEPMHSVVVIAFKDASPRGIGDNALAWANPYAREGPCVTLLMGPLQRAATKLPATSYILTAHTLAHEIAHVLEGVARHSKTGLMREHWSAEDIMNMQDRWLEFAADDATRIRDSFRITSAAK